MSYNILNKGVKFQGTTKGTIEDLVDTHTDQTINGLKTITHLTGTHVRVTNDVVSLGNISASVNISASAFYANGVEISTGGVTINSAAANRITTVASDTSELDAESNLTFNASTKVLQVGSALVTDTALNVYGNMSASVNISASAFYGNGANLTGVQPTLKSGGGLNYDSNELEIKIDTLGLPMGGIDTTDDRFLIYDDSAGALKVVTPTVVGNLNEPVVSTFNGQTQHRVVTVGGSEQIDGEENLTFDGSILTISGDVSGSGFVSASIGHFVTRVEGGAISLGDATGIAGSGLANSNGELEVQVSGAIRITSDKVAITGSFAGNGLQYGGGVNSIDGVAIELDSNSGLAVSASGIKTNFAGLATATPAVASDNLTFIDSDGDKKCSFETFLSAIAGSGLGVLNSQLTASGGGSVDIDALSALGGTGLHQTQDHFMFSDNGTEKKITFSNLEDAIFANISGDIAIAAGGGATIQANAVEGSMINSNVAGSGLDYTSNELRVDVSDFMTNGSDNRIVTATGADAMNAEANLTFDGNLLTGTNATSSFAHYAAGTLTGIGDTQTAYYNASGSGDEVFIHFNNRGNTSPLFAIGGVNHATLPNTITTTAQFKSTAQISSSAEISGSSLYTTNQNNNPLIMKSVVGTSGSVMQMMYKEAALTCGTDNNFDEIAGFFETNMIPVALGVRVTSAIGNNAYITKIGTINDDDSFGTFGNGDLEDAGDNLVTSYHPANATGQNTKWFTSAHEIRITYNATPSSGALRFGLYYYSITPPTS